MSGATIASNISRENPPHPTGAASGSQPCCTPADMQLIEELRQREEAAFARLVEQYQSALLRVARLYVPSHAVAEEVVQETWLGVLRGVERFEGRCSLKTWIFQILINRARTRGERESRMVSFAAMAGQRGDADTPTVEASRFLGAEDGANAGHWAVQPQQWNMTPEQAALSGECLAHIERAIAALPPAQRQVIILRDMQGCTGEEVCNILGVSETNCRVLLHRARAKVREAMEAYLGAGHRNRWEHKVMD
jgi:RNA polymerase sigma-70 factor (ECF subfamily)